MALVDDRWQCGRSDQPHYAVAGNCFAAHPEAYGAVTQTSSGTPGPTDACLKVLKLIGMSPDTAPVAQIEKFIRCNGALGVIKAANAVARRRRNDRGVIRDPWAYCIQAFNGNVARSSVLHPLLYVLENALRSRVDTILAVERGREWYRDVESYLDPQSASRFRKGDDYAQVQDRSGAGEPPYPMLVFRSGMIFVQRIPFAGLQRIIEHNYASGTLTSMFLPPADEPRLTRPSSKRASSEFGMLAMTSLTTERSRRRTFQPRTSALEDFSITSSSTLIERCGESIRLRRASSAQCRGQLHREPCASPLIPERGGPGRFRSHARTVTGVSRCRSATRSDNTCSS